ncbi:MAG: amidohydrolase family protein [Treponema sp.]|jgi:dihydroorotase|nr:amidohydrolase family protein [Treponema sp.]
MLFLDNFRVVDESSDFFGSVVVENGFIKEVFRRGERPTGGPADDPASDWAARPRAAADMVLEGGCPGNGGLVLMPAFVDLHAHFREPGCGEVSAKETLESACLAAVAGGYGTVVSMANTLPPVDSVGRAAALKNRADALGLIDLCPALSLSRGMEGTELSEIIKLPDRGGEHFVRLLSEDGRDMARDDLFLAAFREARRAGLPVSCHCDLGGEYAAVRRAIELAARAGARLHIAHVSTKEAVDLIRGLKARRNGTDKAAPAERTAGEGFPPVENEGFELSCEITPHHLALDEKDVSAAFGKVAPPLGSGADRLALLEALADGTADAVATDHAPHTRADKASGAPGFSGLETAFGVCLGVLAAPEVPAGPGGKLSLKKLSSLMSASPARILGFGGGPLGRGKIAPGYRADLVIVDTEAAWTVDPGNFRSRGKNSPFEKRELRGKVIMTIHRGRVVFDGR